MNIQLSSRQQLTALFVLVLLSRLPFLLPGYGIEEDSWGIALAAMHTKASGVYEPSRLPGHPVHELILSVLWGIGPFWYNFLSALFSAIATLYFALILKLVGVRQFFLAALAFAFVPVIYISSTYTIDFMWTAAFVMISMYLLLRNNFLLCGVFLGLAIGCRITSGAMLLPFLLLIWKKEDLRYNITSIFRIGLTAGIVALITFIPVIVEFGSSFFMYYDQFPYPPASKVFYKMIPGVFGFLGCLAIAGAAFFAYRYRHTEDRIAHQPESILKKMMWAAVSMLILFSISYFRLPQKSGYMIPIVPFVIYLVAYYSRPAHFRYFCFVMVASSFLFSINLTDRLRGSEYSPVAMRMEVSGQEVFLDPLTGPVYSDRSKRRLKTKYCSQVIGKTTGITDKHLVIAGWWYNQIMVTLNDRPQTNIVFVGYIDKAQMQTYMDQGYAVSYLPEQELYNDLMHQMPSFTSSVAVPFEQRFPDQPLPL